MPTYIGFRLNRYGPPITSVVAGRIEIIDVRDRQKYPMLLAVNASDMTVSAHAATRTARPLVMGSGQRRFNTKPANTASAYSAGGGRRAPASSSKSTTPYHSDVTNPTRS